MTIAELSRIFVLLFGIAVSLVSLWAIVVPSGLRQMVRTITLERWGYFLAIFTRLLLGFSLVFAAPASRFPEAFHIIGWLAIIAAIGLVFIGRSKMVKLLEWFEKLSDTFVRGWLLIAVAFGLLLFWGAW